MSDEFSILVTRHLSRERIMTIVRSLFLILILLLFTGSINAAESIKIGYVDLQKVLDESSEGKRVKEEMNKDIEGKKKELEKMQAELKGLQEDYQKSNKLLKPEAQKEKEDLIRGKEKELQRSISDFREEVKRKEQAYSDQIIKEIVEVVKKLGEKEKYTIILEKNFSSVVYAAQNIDLTSAVLQEYNQSKQAKR
jgi:outer membrane protein